MELRSIGAVARESSVAASAIRYYERIGLLPVPQRSGGQRRYDASAGSRLRLIRMAQAAGFGLREIRTLASGFPEGTPPSRRWRAMSQEKITALEARIARLQQMKSVLQDMLRCRCSTLEECASGGAESLCCGGARRG